MKNLTKHYKIQYRTSEQLATMLRQLQPKVNKCNLFFAGMDMVYVTVKGEYDDSAYSTEEEDFHSVITQHFNFTYQSLASKPQPQKNWLGNWQPIDEVLNRLESLKSNG